MSLLARPTASSQTLPTLFWKSVSVPNPCTFRLLKATPRVLNGCAWLSSVLIRSMALHHARALKWSPFGSSVDPGSAAKGFCAAPDPWLCSVNRLASLRISASRVSKLEMLSSAHSSSRSPLGPNMPAALIFAGVLV